ncbi:50S ribosomal protein L31e [Candidatus Pacearchaeota archaeon]|nr:50S ribosomal protein L31e [Candidatus Pacearchaeota archaeon]
MAKKTERATNKVEREYVIPLREKCRPVPRYRKTEKAIKTIKEFVARHMKIYDKDLSKIKLDNFLNEMVWSRGIKNPPHKIKVKVIKDGDIVRVEAVELTNKLKFKKSRETERDKKAEAGLKKKKAAETKPEEKPVEKKTEEQLKEDAEKKREAEEKKSATIEAGQEMEKAAAKQIKHQVGGKEKEPKHPHRMSLQK